MKLRIALASAALVTTGAATVVTAQPAEATSCFLGFCQAGFVIHGKDADYDPPMLVACAADADFHRVAEGTSSDPDCDGEFSDMDGVIVRQDEEWWCKGASAPFWIHYELTFDKAGLHEVGDGFAKKCVLHRD